MERRELVKVIATAGVAAGLGGMVTATGLCADAATSTSSAPAASKEGPLIRVHKDPACGCCGQWVEHLRRDGFKVEVFEEDDMGQVKERLGVPHGKASCHTGEVQGYLIEGHVPASDIRRLLAERPRARGLVLPGMPIGSPGMEIPGTPAQAYTVELVRPDGQTEVFARHSS